MSEHTFTAKLHNARPATVRNEDCWLAAIYDGRVVVWSSGECETEAEARTVLAYTARQRGIELATIEDTTDHAAIARRNAEEMP